MQATARKLQTAFQHHQAGRFQQAENIYRQILRIDPQHADAMHLLGVISHQHGRHEQAVEQIGRALAVQPLSPVYLNNLGGAYQALKLYPQAQRAYELALRIKGDYVDAYNNLGVTHFAQGQLDAARECYLQAIRLDARFAQAHLNLGNVYREREQFADAEACYRAALDIRPQYPLALNNLGNVVIKDASRVAEARDCYQKAIALDPNYADPHENLAISLVIEGRSKEAVASFQRAFAIQPRDGLQIKAAFALPVILESAKHPHELRERLDTEIERLLQTNLRIDDPISLAGMNLFHLAYHGVNDRNRLSQIAALYRHACPVLNYVAPHCQTPAESPQGRPLRVGFVSKFFHSHSVGLHYAGVVRNFAREGFHVTVCRYAGPDDEIARSIDARADQVVTLSSHLPTAQRQVAEQELDVLFHIDIGMAPHTYFLACARLARVQCVTNGHPITTGISTLDYFISCDAIEPANGEDHYTERLIRMENIPNYYERPRPLGPAKSRADFGLSDDWHLYLCPQNLCKIHPDFDGIVENILRGDPRGRLVLFHGSEKYWSECLLARFQRKIPDVLDRIDFLPTQPFGDFLHLLTLGDAILDTTHFCGGTTTAQALALGAPIVTLPGEFMRSRITAGCYQRMGMLDCVAADADDYARIALLLGTDADYRVEVRQKILAHNAILYDNPGFVRELEAFFTKVCRSM